MTGIIHVSQRMKLQIDAELDRLAVDVAGRVDVRLFSAEWKLARRIE